MRGKEFKRKISAGIVAVLGILVAEFGFALDIEPRRWASLPVGMNVIGAGVIHTDSEIFSDPVTKLEDVTLDMETVALSYIRSFEFLGQSSRFDILLPYSDARWEGLLDGVAASTERKGWRDPRLRFSVNLLGSPALAGKEYQVFRATHKINTVVGAALAVNLPLGHYEKDKFLNLGQNRFVFQPQIGLVHSRGPWSYELTGSVFLYSENDNFFGGQTLEEDPLFAIQSHLNYTSSKRWWLSLSAAYDWGGESTLNGIKMDDYKRDMLYGISAGYTLNPKSGIKLVYVASHTMEDVGSDTDYVLLSYILRL